MTTMPTRTTTTSPSNDVSMYKYFLHTPCGSFRSFPILIAAQYAKLDMTIVSQLSDDDDDTNTIEEQIRMSPTGKTPFLRIMKPSENKKEKDHEDDIILFGSHAIAKYICTLEHPPQDDDDDDNNNNNNNTNDDKNNNNNNNNNNNTIQLLYHGNTTLQQAMIDGWMEYTLQELDIPSTVWTYPIMGYMPFHEAASNKAKQDLLQGFEILNQVLSKHNNNNTSVEEKEESSLLQYYIIGTMYPTLADVIVVSSLYYPMKFNILGNDDTTREGKSLFPYLIRWYNQCRNQPEFQTILQ